MKWEEVSQSEIELAINAAGGDLFKAAAIVKMDYPDLIRQVEKSDTLQQIAEEAKHVRVKPKSLKNVRPFAEQPNKVYSRPTAGSINSRILVISDTHAPYHHKDTIEFLRSLHKKHKFTRIVHIGDECFPPDAEVLTEHGWERFDEYNRNTKVAQWHEDGTVDFVLPDRKLEKHYNGDLLEISHSTYYSLTTPRHKIVKIRPSTGEVFRREACDTYGSSSWYIPRGGVHSGEGVPFTEDEIRLQVAFEADGTFDKGAVKFGFKRERKIERLKAILSRLNVPFIERTITRGDVIIYIKKADVPAYLSKKFTWPIERLSIQQKNIILEEAIRWDGTDLPVGFRYVSCSESMDYMQAVAVSAGHEATRTPSYLNVLLDRQEKTSQKSAQFKCIPYDGMVYCVTVPTGMIIVRQNGMVNVTGNCDNHAMSFHDSDPDLPSAGNELHQARIFLHELERIFPEMDIVKSNHGDLYERKARAGGIPAEAIVPRATLYRVGGGWHFHDDIILKLPTGYHCMFVHGRAKNVLNASKAVSMSFVQGHFHTEFGIKYWRTPHALHFGMAVGCLIDRKSLAMHYAKDNREEQLIGCGMILEGMPCLAPMFLDKDGNWTGLRP